MGLTSCRPEKEEALFASPGLGKQEQNMICSSLNCKRLVSVSGQSPFTATPGGPSPSCPTGARHSSSLLMMIHWGDTRGHRSQTGALSLMEGADARGYHHHDRDSYKHKGSGMGLCGPRHRVQSVVWVRIGNTTEHNTDYRGLLILYLFNNVALKNTKGLLSTLTSPKFKILR